jgi:hypothetical protein
MFCQTTFAPWRSTIMPPLPPLRKSQAIGFALRSLGMVRARSCALSAVSACMAEGLRPREHTGRQRLRAWCYEATATRGAKRQEGHVETWLAPWLAWVLSWWQGRQLAIALEATPWGQRFVVLALRVVARGGALPVAGGILEAGKKGLVPRVAPDAPAASPCGAARLDRDRAGRAGLVCPGGASHGALRVASLFAPPHRRDVAARGLASGASAPTVRPRGRHGLERAGHGGARAGPAAGVHAVGLRGAGLQRPVVAPDRSGA